MKITRTRIKKRKPKLSITSGVRKESPKEELERLRRTYHETFYMRGFLCELSNSVADKTTRAIEVGNVMGEILDKLDELKREVSRVQARLDEIGDKLDV